MATYSKFTLTCDQIYSYSDEFTEKFTKPFELGIDQVEHIKEKIAETSTLSVREVLGLPESEQTHNEPQQVPEEQVFMTPVSGFITTQNTSQESILTNEETVLTGASNGLLGRVEILKQRLVDQVMQDQDFVNNGICDVLISSIKDRFDKPVFQFSVIVLMYLLLYPIIRLIIFIMEFISLAIIGLLRLTKTYTFITKKEEVEDIQ